MSESKFTAELAGYAEKLGFDCAFQTYGILRERPPHGVNHRGRDTDTQEVSMCSNYTTPCYISLTNSDEFVLCDWADYEQLSSFPWHNGGVGGRYAKSGLGKRASITYMHRFLMLPGPEEVVHHVNGDGLDNRRSNLLVVSATENKWSANIRSDNTSGYTGVTISYGKWSAEVGGNAAKVVLGRFDDPIDAALARDLYILKYRPTTGRPRFLRANV